MVFIMLLYLGSKVSEGEDKRATAKGFQSDSFVCGVPAFSLNPRHFLIVSAMNRAKESGIVSEGWQS